MPRPTALIGLVEEDELKQVALDVERQLVDVIEKSRL
jgi:hypothetical protein